MLLLSEQDRSVVTLVPDMHTATCGLEESVVDDALVTVVANDELVKAKAMRHVNTRTIARKAAPLHMVTELNDQPQATTISMMI